MIGLDAGSLITLSILATMTAMSLNLIDYREPSRQRVARAMQEIMGPLPSRKSRVPLNVETISEFDAGTFLRKRITYQSFPGERVNAYLLVPKNASNPSPAILCLHETVNETINEPVGLSGRPSMHYGKELAERGFIVIVPEYPTLGDHAVDLRGHGWVSGSMKAIWDNMRAIDLLESIPQTDRGRIAAIGHSLGGHNSLFTAVFDKRIKCVVTSCGFTAFAKYYGGDLTGWSSIRYMPAIAERKLTPTRMPFDFKDIFEAIAPIPIFVSAPLHDANFDVGGVKDVIEAAKLRYASLGHPERLAAVFPDCEHDWPLNSRVAAYQFIERQLGARR